MEHKLADPGKRAIAFIIDIIVLFVINLVMGGILGAIGIGAAAASADANMSEEQMAGGIVAAMMGMGLLYQVITLVAEFLYFALMEASSLQATLGKRIMGLKVVKEDGGTLDFTTSAIRNVVKIICLIPCGLGILVGFFTANKQGVQDMAAKTHVVQA
jgi:uncharacterized RDD family membrane protein YckC